MRLLFVRASSDKHLDTRANGSAFEEPEQVCVCVGGGWGLHFLPLFCLTALNFEIVNSLGRS